jgi:hypothetical protein
VEAVGSSPSPVIRAEPQGWRDDLRVAALPWLLARVLVGAVLGLIHYVVNQVGDCHPGVHLKHVGLYGWDAGWYKGLALGGYHSQPREALRFFPLLPEVVHYLGLGGHAAGPILLIVVNVAALAYGVLFAHLLRVEGVDAATIVRAQWLLALAPPAFVLAMGYSEAIFGLLAVGMFLGLRTGRWPLAVACGLLAGLTRPVGVLLALPALVEAWQARERPLLPRLAPVVAPLAGAAIYLGWVWARYGDALLPIRVQQEAGRHGQAANPLHVLSSAARGTVHGQVGTGLHLPWLVLFVILLVVLARRWPLSWTVWAGATLIATLVGSNLDSSERYAWGVFPFVVAAAGLLRRPLIWQTVLVLSTAGFVAYATLAFLTFYVP